jgi:alpha-1,2-glucosyltransferase
MLVLAVFAALVVWNGGIVLGKVYQSTYVLFSQLTDFQGDKSNHIPVLHIPQLYYFIASTTFFGWPILISAPDGVLGLTRGVWGCMFGNRT